MKVSKDRTMEYMKIAFVLDHKLHHYRLPFFEDLMDKGYQIDIYHVGPEIEIGDNSNIKQIIIKSSQPLKKLLYFQLPSLKAYSAVVIMQNIRLVNLWLCTLSLNRRYKLLHWGIGVSSSKGLPQKPDFISKVRNILSNYADALVFYSDYPLRFFNKKNRAKSFVAHNTVFNPLSKDTSKLEKDSFLFIGSLNNRKGLDTLLSAFKHYLKVNQSEVRYLNIVGDGDNIIKKNLFDFANKEGLIKNIRFIGPLFDNEEKLMYFEKAAACISPKQAGLSVLESFSYGVPFICFENAISGGEHINIQNGYTGYLVNSEKELIQKMLLLTSEKSRTKNMGSNAFRHYTEKRSMDVMVDEFDKAIQFSLKK